MKFMSSGDLHLHSRNVGGRPRLPVMMGWLDECLALCVRFQTEHLFLAGDVLDSKHGIERETLLAWFQWLVKARLEGVEVHWLRGNHETPRNNAPKDTLMQLFSEVCDVICVPKTIRLGETLVGCLPWFPADVFKTYARKLTAYAKAAGDTRRRILVSHVGLRDGRVSPSNIQLPQRVGVRDLLPAEWDLILLGDYHNTQSIGETGHVLYMGSPLPHTFGDFNHAGPWLVHDEGKDHELKLVNLQSKLATRYPVFQKYDLAEGSDLTVPGYDSRDYNRITCPAADLAEVKLMYPTADVLVSAATNKPIDTSGSRLSSKDAQDPQKAMKRYLAIRKIDPTTILPLANALLKAAAGT